MNTTTQTLRQSLQAKIAEGNQFIVMDEVNGLDHALANNYVYKTREQAENEAAFQKKTYGRDCIVIDINSPIREQWSVLEDAIS